MKRDNSSPIFMGTEVIIIIIANYFCIDRAIIAQYQWTINLTQEEYLILR